MIFETITFGRGDPAEARLSSRCFIADPRDRFAPIAQSPIGQRPKRPHGAGALLPAPRFGRGGSCLGHPITPRRISREIRVRHFNPSPGRIDWSCAPTMPHPTHTGRVSGCIASASPTERSLAFAEQALRFHPSVRARRCRFRSPHTSPAKCLRIPRSAL